MSDVVRLRRSEPDVSYEIRDATGTLVAVHGRWNSPRGKRLAWRLPDGTWDQGLQGVSVADLPLYGAHRLGDCKAVVVTEGEKAADALTSVGIPAVATVCGAHTTPSIATLGDLDGHIVVLWPDADEVGHNHMRRIASLIEGRAAAVRWIDWPDAPEHGDAADVPADQRKAFVDSAGDVPVDRVFEPAGLGYVARWLDSGAELRVDRLNMSRGELSGMLQASLRGKHLAFGRFNLSSIQTRGHWAKMLEGRAKGIDWAACLETLCVETLAAETKGEPIVTVGRNPRRDAIPYLVYPILPRDRATIVFGEGGTGKSYLAADIAVMVATGVQTVRGWSVTSPGPVLVLDWEADADEWNERIGACARGVGLEPPDVHYRACVGSLVEQVEDIARAVAEIGARLVIVDSVGMATPPGRDGGDANEGAIRLFAAIRHLRTTALLIDHVTGADMGKDRVIKPYGSVYKVNLARSVFELKRQSSDHHEEEEGVSRVGLFHRKVNGGTLLKPMGLRYLFSEDEFAIERFEISDAEPELVAGMTIHLQIQRLLRGGPLTAPQIADLMDKPDNSIRAILNRFKGEMFVRLDKDRWANLSREEAA